MTCSGAGTISSLESSWAESTLKKLSLREKIAQMMVYRMNMKFMNYESDEWKEIEKLISSDGIGVLHIWFGEAGSALTLLNKMQKASKVPMLVEADIESGLGRRYSGAVTLPPMMAIAATGDPQYAYEAGRISAVESRAVGIHFNLAPVVDVNNNPKNPIINTRSFGEDPDSVYRYSKEFIKGLHDYNMLATAKHFPGHGDTETDSHSALAQIPSDSSRLWTVEIPPFRNAINAGVDAIMVAHVNAPDYQKNADDPATLSSFWIKNILKNNLGFDGAIITDAMGMGGIIKNYSDAYALIATINAGSDIIIQNNKMKESIDLVERAVLDGIITEQRINQSVIKILKMKEKVGLHKDPAISADKTHLDMGKKINFETANEIASRSLTVVKNDNNILPLNPELNEDIYVIDLYDGPNNHTESSLTKQLRQSKRKIKTFQIDKSDSLAIADYIFKQIPDEKIVFVNAFANPVEWKDNIFLPEVEADLINRLINKSSKVVVTSFGSPYLIQDFPSAPVYICAYKGSGIMQDAVAKLLMGKSNASGILPVTIPDIANRGSGLYIESQPWVEQENPLEPGTELMTIRANEIGVDIAPITIMLNDAVQDSAFPGGVILAAKNGKIFLHEAFGYHTYLKSNPTARGNIFDLASITKVISTTSAIMNLVEEKKLKLSDRVIDFVPEFRGQQDKFFRQKENTTIQQLITHTAGLPPFKQYYLMDGNQQTRLDSIFNTEPQRASSDTLIYSDIGLIVLGKVVEVASQQSLDEYVDSVVFKPLGMNSTFYNPSMEKLQRIVPTENSKFHQKLIRGFVHDENAHSLGGVAGHAGLFSTAKDLAIFSQMMLNGGRYGWKRIFMEETIIQFTTRSN
ncbi:MAG: glycoside hydrolase family 3 N-terminal domain-containing protein, partial [Candidatus Neomarinimicrobiota bacterium]|nr:glycoside hydrolase family 3 N-terminal domain-containing protein [Candidatus Neomarinimicrobiota bacterium]